MYLVDTNVWVESLLKQDRADEAREFFKATNSHLLAISDFSLFSIGILLIRLGKHDSFFDFIEDTMEEGKVRKVSLSLSQLKEISSACRTWGLDFDDAYQYLAAKTNDLILVSFDRDFDRTDRKRKTPRQIIQK
jgi:hypothetical protein